MIGFHIDMNMAQYQSGYLFRWVRDLAKAGYDTILWEVENNILFDTCPECASPDAFTKDEFREILKECRRLNLEPIPLFQTIGHAEYVLKHEKYAHLKELPDRLDQYCPQNPEVVPFLRHWIEEYLDVFGPVRYFHIGADEAWWIGQCPKCRAYAEEHSISQLYIEHVNQIIEPLLSRGITPVLWADMVLHYPEALHLLPRQVMLFDWIYSVYRGSGKVQVWGSDLTRSEDLNSETLSRYGAYLYPQGKEPGREPETFYTADYLAAQGFQVVTCPSASSYGDNVFSPRTWLHTANTFDSFKKGAQSHLHGSVLTSWSVHLFPWEMQWTAIHVPSFLSEQPGGGLQEYPGWFENAHFGAQGGAFWRAAGLLSRSCLFTHTASLGFRKDCLPLVEGYVSMTLQTLIESGAQQAELENCLERLAEYTEALRIFQSISAPAARGQAELDVWKLAARNLLSRTRASLFLLEHAPQVIHRHSLEDVSEREEARHLIAEQAHLKIETESFYQQIIRPTRRAEMIEYMFGAVIQALEDLVKT